MSCAGVAVDDADVQVVDEQGDRGAGEAGAEADVVQPAVVAHGDAEPPVSIRSWSGPGSGRG